MKTETKETASQPLRLLDEIEVGRLLGIAASTVATMRREGTGPQFVKFGRISRYRWADVEEWLIGRRQQKEAKD
jgi:predicted DNA-binding transcriptional regulator AlpA